MQSIGHFVVFVFSISYIFCDENNINFCKEQIIKPDGSIDSIFFGPDSGETMRKTFLGLIESTTNVSSIHAALFRLSEESIIEALVDAHKRGVPVKVLLDPGALECKKVLSLCQNGISLYFLRNQKAGTCMHHKIMCFRNVFDTTIIASGSLNLTSTGFKKNHENITFRNDPVVTQQYTRELDNLFQQSDEYVIKRKKFRKTGETQLKCVNRVALQETSATLQKLMHFLKK